MLRIVGKVTTDTSVSLIGNTNAVKEISVLTVEGNIPNEYVTMCLEINLCTQKGRQHNVFVVE